MFKMGCPLLLRAEQDVGVIARDLWDTLAFSKLRARLLPAAELVITDYAPISKQANDFLCVCLVFPVAKGYSLPETACGMPCFIVGCSKSGAVGSPLIGLAHETEYYCRKIVNFMLHFLSSPILGIC